MSELYERIHSLCEQRGVNVTTMCTEAGVGRGSLSDLKKGRIRALGADALLKVATYLGVPVEYLLTGEMPPTADGSSAFAQRFFAAYGETPPSFSDEQIQDIAQFARFVAQKKGDGNGPA